MEITAENRTPLQMLGIALIRQRLETCKNYENARLVNAILWDSNFENGADKLLVTFEDHEQSGWVYIRVDCVTANGDRIPDSSQLFSIAMRDIRHELSCLRKQALNSFSLVQKK